MTAALAVNALDPDRVETRAVDATLACIARHGLSKTTIDDIAREAGCSRATLYRYFGSRQELVTAAVHAEASRVASLVREVAGSATTLEDAVVGVLGVAGRELGEHPALRFVADVEPDQLLPYLTFAGGDRFLQDAAGAIAPCFARFLGDDAERAAEWVARIGLALWLSPTAPVSLADAEALRGYVRAFVLPAIQPSHLPEVRNQLSKG
ncbi:MAG: TetR/AcrR family transcriptional regulator [Acidimicrobiia bacterium]|nr:TetR/AcrR family transcriptional regulator [Acidimicrobiia bacterium]